MILGILSVSVHLKEKKKQTNKQINKNKQTKKKVDPTLLWVDPNF